MATPYKLAFSPGRIGKLELENRLLNGPAIPNFSKRDGSVTQREIDYYAEKANGGYGGVFVSGTSVNDTTARSFTNQPGVHDDALLPGWRSLSAAIHESGARCGVQIFHPGRQNHPKYSGGGAIPEAPSALPCPLESSFPGYEVRAMTAERVREVVREYAAAACRLKNAGFDWVEIHGAHGYLPMQFLSPATNVRTDEYGGSFTNRTRFISEVMNAIRDAVGSDFTVGIRFSADELVEGGVTLMDTRSYAWLLAELGFSYLSVSAGTYTPSGLYSMLLGCYSPPNHLEPLTGAIREAVDLPILQYGGFTSVAQAEEVLRKGTADFVIMNRASIADPHIVRKTLEQREEEIRPCIRCNNGCIDRLYGMRDISCTMNPELGREREFQDKLRRKAPRSKRVMVVGGGPGGMAAAKYARLMGHDVTLFEREAELGGLNRYAGRGPGREEWAELGIYYGRQLRQLGVPVVLETHVTAETVRSFSPEVVVVATGSRFQYPIVEGLRRPDGTLASNAVALPDVLMGRAPAGERVVVVGGNHMGVQAARCLSEQGKTVTLVEALPELNQDLDGFINWFGFLLPDLRERGVKIMTHAYVREITPQGVIVEESGDIPPLLRVGPLKTVDTETFIACDTVVVGTGRASESQLFEQLAGTIGGGLYVIGDAVKPRWAYSATGEGATVGINL